jgi:BRO1-like domain
MSERHLSAVSMSERPLSSVSMVLLRQPVSNQHLVEQLTRFTDELASRATAAAATAALERQRSQDAESTSSEEPIIVPLSSQDYDEDLVRLVQLRESLVDLIHSYNNSSVRGENGDFVLEQRQQLEKSLQFYHAVLLEFTRLGFPSCDSDDPTGTIQFPWQPSASMQPQAFRLEPVARPSSATRHRKHAQQSEQFPLNGESYSDDRVFSTDDESDAGDECEAAGWPSKGELESHGSFVWERSNVLWNLASCHVDGAGTILKSLGSNTAANEQRQLWSQVGVHYQNAAVIVHYLRTKVMVTCSDVLLKHYRHDENSIESLTDEDSMLMKWTCQSHSSSATMPIIRTELSGLFLYTWEVLLIAKSQHAAYEAFATTPRPRHFMLAKLAIAAVPLYSSAAQHAERLIEQLHRHQEHQMLTTTGDALVMQSWMETSRAWEMFFSALAEYHQAIGKSGRTGLSLLIDCCNTGLLFT